MTKRIKALVQNFFLNILIPVLYFLPLMLIIFVFDGFGTQSFESKLQENFFLYFLIILSMVGFFYISVGFGKINFSNYILFSYRFGNRIHDVSFAGDTFYDEERGSTGLAVIVVNILKCFIVMPLRLIAGIIKIPIIIFSDGYRDSLDIFFSEERKSRFFTFVILIASILLCLPATFAKKSQLETYDLNDMYVDYAGLKLESYNPNDFGGMYQYSIAFSISQGDLFIRQYGGRIEITVDNTLVTSFGCEYNDITIYPGGTEVNNINGVYVQYLFPLYGDFDNLETISQGNDRNMEIQYSLESISYGETEKDYASYEFNEMDNRPGPSFLLFKNYN